MYKALIFTCFFIYACDTIPEPANHIELCNSIAQEYSACIINYCSENAPKYDWNYFLDSLINSINEDCLIRPNTKLYSSKFLNCFRLYSCKEVLMFDKCEVGLQAQNYCGVSRLN